MHRSAYDDRITRRRQQFPADRQPYNKIRPWRQGSGLQSPPGSAFSMDGPPRPGWFGSVNSSSSMGAPFSTMNATRTPKAVYSARREADLVMTSIENQLCSGWPCSSPELNLLPSAGSIGPGSHLLSAGDVTFCFILNLARNWVKSFVFHSTRTVGYPRPRHEGSAPNT